MSLTKDQTLAYNKFLEFIDNDENLYVLCGSGGTGKTYLTKYFSESVHNTSLLCGISPTHKAKIVLSKTLNTKTMKEIAVFTIAVLLGKNKDHSYIGTHKYSSPVEKKLSSYEIFILDEVSMVSDKDLQFLINYVVKHNKKLIMIGDKYQIPCPSQHLICKGDMCYKVDSLAFNLGCVSTLNEIVRQAKGSPIITLATSIRDNIDVDNDLLGVYKIEDFYPSFVYSLKKYPLTTRCITYTNDAVAEYNRNIRKQLGYKVPYLKGEILMAYTTIGFPSPIIINGCDYVISDVNPTKNYMLNNIACTGHILKLTDLSTNHVTPGLFFISVDHNFELMTILVELAQKVNAKGSTKEDYKKYKTLKDKVIVCENIYKYNSKILSKSQFKEIHPLLFSKSVDVLDDKLKIKVNTLSKKIIESYPKLLENRMIDSKTLDESESLCDQFMIIEKDMDYGYALTAHKSQASTYDVVYVDHQDFNKIKNRWNWKYQKMENRTREKNQLIYVSVSRAKLELHVI